MNKPKTIYLIGFPGVGKLTVAKALKKKLENCDILDNHLSNDCIFPFAEVDKNRIDAYSDEAWKAIGIIKNTIWDFIINHGKPNQTIILTNVLVDGYAPSEMKSFLKRKKFAEDRNSLFVPVRLICDTNELKRRVVSEERQNSEKASNTEIIDKFLGEGFTVLKSDEENELTIDNTNLQPDDVADIIIKHCEKL